MPKITMLSCDPVTKNFASALVSGTYTNGKLRFKIHGTRVMERTVLSLVDEPANQMAQFIREVEDVISNAGLEPEALYMERFQSRGNGGTTIECINFMLGTMVYHFRDRCPVSLLTAATWKNRVNRYLILKEAYKAYGLQLKASPKTAHELDAVLIGMYGICRHFGVDDFACFDDSEGSEEYNKKFDGFMEYFLQAPHLKV
jgi:hypothetical protein